jgi:hypothetical protein
VLGADGGHRARAHLGDQRGVHDRQRDAVGGIEDGHHGQLARQALPIVGHEITDDLDSAEAAFAQRVDVAAEHVEVARAVVARDQMRTRFEHRLASAVRADHAFDGRDHVGRPEAQRVDVGAGEEPQPDLPSGVARVNHAMHHIT